MTTARVFLWFCISVVALVGSVDAATLRVPSEYPTIQSAIDAAVSGDTVMVAPGTYTNCDALPCRPSVGVMKSGVSVVSEAGAAATTVRIDSSAGGLASFEGHGVSDCTLDGFTITGTAPGYHGAAFLGCDAIEVRNCRFVDLAGGVDIAGGLGAIQTNITVAECEFIRCEAVTTGGGLLVDLGSVTIDRCLFEECVRGGASLNGHAGLSASVKECVFRNNTGNTALTVLAGYDAEICDNLFVGNSSPRNATAFVLNNDPGAAL